MERKKNWYISELAWVRVYVTIDENEPLPTNVFIQ